LFSCDNEKKHYQVDLSEIEKPNIEVKSYARAMFPIAQDSLKEKLPSYVDEFGVFLGGDIHNPAAILQLKNFFTDPHLKELYEISLKDYPDFQNLEAQLSESFHYLNYYAPGLVPENVYTYISGLDYSQPIKITSEKDLIIALDLYLESADKIYKSTQIPLYKMRWMNEESIKIDVAKKIAESVLADLGSTPNLLDNMIRSGKAIYFAKILNPNLNNNLILKYTESQYDWMLENQSNVWSLLIENSFLFETKKQIINKFMDDAPFTTSFNKKSPPRIGEYFGFRIVEAYMMKNDISIQELFSEKDSQKILQLSKYKPV
jgi:hypothetical protein